MAFATSNISGVNFTQIDKALNTTNSGYDQFVETGSGFAPGTIVWSSSGSAYVYVTFGSGGATGMGYLCNISPSFEAVMTTSSNDAFGAPVGAAQDAASATDKGWLQVYGPGLLRGAASTAANVPLSATTAGEVDDGGAVGTLVIDGLIYTTAVGGAAGTAAAWFNWPKYITNPNVTPA